MNCIDPWVEEKKAFFCSCEDDTIQLLTDLQRHSPEYSVCTLLSLHKYIHEQLMHDQVWQNTKITVILLTFPNVLENQIPDI